MRTHEVEKLTKRRYKTTKWREYNQALKTRGSLSVWLEDMAWFAAPTGKRGRRPTFSEAAVQFCLSIKCLGEGEWKRKKHGAEYRRQWCKVRLGIDAQTLKIRAIEVTDNRVGDAPMLPHLLAQIPTDEIRSSVSADGAYDTMACHETIAERGAQAVIPPRKNAKLWKDASASAQARNQAVRACKRLGSRLWKKWSGYHRRSLVETSRHCFKRLGERVMARTFERQVTELHIRVALLNRFTRLGCPVTVSVA